MTRTTTCRSTSVPGAIPPTPSVATGGSGRRSTIAGIALSILLGAALAGCGSASTASERMQANYARTAPYFEIALTNGLDDPASVSVWRRAIRIDDPVVRAWPRYADMQEWGREADPLGRDVLAMIPSPGRYEVALTRAGEPVSKAFAHLVVDCPAGRRVELAAKGSQRGVTARIVVTEIGMAAMRSTLRPGPCRR